MVIDPKVREKRLQQMTFLYELITKDNEEDKILVDEYFLLIVQYNFHNLQ